MIRPEAVPSLANGLTIPHYHVILRQGSTVWTYIHPGRAPRQIRRLTEYLFTRGHRPLILRCERAACKLYAGATTLEEVARRLTQLRHDDDSYVQLRPAPE